VTNVNIQLIQVKSGLDYETVQTYTLSIQPSTSSTNHLTLTVHVIDVDDMGVEFKQERYNCSIQENVGVDLSISL